VKRFLKQDVEVGKYPGVTVEFIPGRTPEMIKYGEDDAEIGRQKVDGLSYAQLGQLMEELGFVHEDGTAADRITKSSSAGGNSFRSLPLFRKIAAGRSRH